MIYILFLILFVDKIQSKTNPIIYQVYKKYFDSQYYSLQAYTIEDEMIIIDLPLKKADNYNINITPDQRFLELTSIQIQTQTFLRWPYAYLDQNRNKVFEKNPIPTNSGMHYCQYDLKYRQFGECIYLHSGSVNFQVSHYEGSKSFYIRNYLTRNFSKLIYFESTQFHLNKEIYSMYQQMKDPTDYILMESHLVLMTQFIFKQKIIFLVFNTQIKMINFNNKPQNQCPNLEDQQTKEYCQENTQKCSDSNFKLTCQKTCCLSIYDCDKLGSSSSWCQTLIQFEETCHEAFMKQIENNTFIYTIRDFVINIYKVNSDTSIFYVKSKTLLDVDNLNNQYKRSKITSVLIIFKFKDNLINKGNHLIVVLETKQDNFYSGVIMTIVNLNSEVDDIVQKQIIWHEDMRFSVKKVGVSQDEQEVIIMYQQDYQEYKNKRFKSKYMYQKVRILYQNDANGVGFHIIERLKYGELPNKVVSNSEWDVIAGKTIPQCKIHNEDNSECIEADSNEACYSKTNFINNCGDVQLGQGSVTKNECLQKGCVYQNKTTFIGYKPNGQKLIGIIPVSLEGKNIYDSGMGTLIQYGQKPDWQPITCRNITREVAYLYAMIQSEISHGFYCDSITCCILQTYNPSYQQVNLVQSTQYNFYTIYDHITEYLISKEGFHYPLSNQPQPQPCPSGCKRCSSLDTIEYTRCSECNKGYYYHLGKCLEICPINYYTDYINFRCFQSQQIWLKNEDDFYPDL